MEAFFFFLPFYFFPLIFFRHFLTSHPRLVALFKDVGQHLRDRYPQTKSVQGICTCQGTRDMQAKDGGGFSSRFLGDAYCCYHGGCSLQLSSTCLNRMERLDERPGLGESKAGWPPTPHFHTMSSSSTGMATSLESLPVEDRDGLWDCCTWR